MSSDAEVFISYGHLDDEAPFGGDGWVAAFHKALDVCLGRRLGRNPRIWRDPKLAGNDEFPATLTDELANVSALICVLSPKYLASEWCRRELREFSQLAGLRPAPGRATRVFKVVMTNVPLEDHPEEVRDRIGYEFFRADKQSGSDITLDPTIDPSMKPEYWVKLNDLAQDLCRLLKADERAGAAAGQPPEPAAELPAEEGAAPEPELEHVAPRDGGANGQPRIFLAQTTFDLKPQHDRIKRDLKDHGYEVLPDQNLPLVAAELEPFLREQLMRCRLSIHLVSGTYGLVPEGASEDLTAVQNSIAAECCGEGKLQRLIWLADGGQSSDEKQQAFIESLRRDNRNHLDADLLEGSLEDLKTVIHRRLEPQRQAAAEAPSEGDLTRAYIICDQADLEDTEAVEEYLRGRGLDVIPSAFGGTPEEVRLDLQENLASCDAVLIYYGAGNQMWQRRKERELQKSAGYGRQRPLLASAIWVAPPPTPEKERLKPLQRTLLLRPEADPGAEKLEEFLQAIENARVKRAG